MQKNVLLKNSVFSEQGFSDSKNPIFYMCFSILGLCLGVICETINNEVYSTLDGYYVSYLDTLKGQTFLQSFLNFAATNLIFIVFALLFGLCAVGYQLLCFIPLLKGLGIGCICSYIYSSFGLSGVLYCSLVVFLPSVIVFTALIISCSQSNRMSKALLNLVDKKIKENEELNVRFFILRYVIIALIIIIASIIYATMLIFLKRLIL